MLFHLNSRYEIVVSAPKEHLIPSYSFLVSFDFAILLFSLAFLLTKRPQNH